jgi:hypothetical protein
MATADQRAYMSFLSMNETRREDQQDNRNLSGSSAAVLEKRKRDGWLFALIISSCPKRSSPARLARSRQAGRLCNAVKYATQLHKIVKRRQYTIIKCEDEQNTHKVS